MMGRVFVCGMLRSGTTLAQTLLTNHPDMLVVYQPFHQLYVDVKQMFLREHHIVHSLPLDDGTPAGEDERAQFMAWLRQRRFDATEVQTLAASATSGKGGGTPELRDLAASPGTFAELRDELHEALAARFAGKRPAVVGSKEILCDEYLPALLDAGVKCVLLVRDPRGVIASANNGSYREMVGDRYPLMMLIRLWRKSAAYWLRFRSDPRVQTIRYEDLVAAPDRILADLARWLGVDPFPAGLAGGALNDHRGQPWFGNSSFGSKTSVDARAADAWRQLLPEKECRFVSACTRWELERLGYAIADDIGPHDIENFDEDLQGVRPSYLAAHPIDEATRRHELERLRSAIHEPDSAPASRFFLFAERISKAGATR